MKNLLEKSAIIELKLKGMSNRGVARTLGIDKKTVNKYWNQYNANISKLDETTEENIIKQVQEDITSAPKYNSENRVRRKVTHEFLNALEKILEDEEKKVKVLGTNKQALTKQQIYELLKKQGVSLSYSTVVLEMKRIKSTGDECFIRQDYDFGDRLEYDFGEVKLVINGIVKRYYLAVLSSPAGNFRWCYLYDNCKKSVFMDSHVRFFEMIGGVWREIVYDNMRNVVSKFIGKNEKELNEDLIKMSMYYGFEINVTNAFSGNEKGYVEGSVKYLRNKIFAENYKFPTEEVAIEYMESQLMKLNESSKIEEEKKNLISTKPPLELAEIRKSCVNKYSFVQIENNFYSVPEYLVGLNVTSKIYYNRILIYSNNELVCEHKKIDGKKKISADIRHYLKTLTFKPGALRNSYVFKNYESEIKEAMSKSQLTAYKRKFEKYDLVILDELGYVSFDKEGCEILFNLLSNRNDKGSIIITTNLTFDRWEEIFKDAMLTGAMVDRLAYKVHILDLSRNVSHRYEETVSWKNSKNN